VLGLGKGLLRRRGECCIGEGCVREDGMSGSEGPRSMARDDFILILADYDWDVQYVYESSHSTYLGEITP